MYRNMTLFNEGADPKALSPLALAFVGDAVFSLYIREMLVSKANMPAGKLHTLSVQWVNASSQADGMRKILPLLTEEELGVFKRGRNAHTSHTPKNQSGCDYHWATGFEALLGYLYLKGESQRLGELLKLACGADGDEITPKNNSSTSD